MFRLALLHLPPKRTVEFMTRRREKFKENKEFSSLFERNAKNISGLKATEAQCYLSVVIPAMNEEVNDIFMIFNLIIVGKTPCDAR